MIKLYEVGGTVRDKFMGIPNKDNDFAVECDSFAEMRYYILSHGGSIYQERPQFGTIRGQYPGLGDADFTMCRKDGFYSDGRHPDSVMPGSILDDLARRDFTMNAIAKDLDTGEFIDPYDGRGDIEYGIIKCVGNTADRMNEDALRILRAMRFSITKNMRLHIDILDFLNPMYQPEYLLANVSRERIYEEMRKMFAASTIRSWQMMSRFPHIFMFCFDKMGIYLAPGLV